MKLRSVLAAFAVFLVSGAVTLGAPAETTVATTERVSVAPGGVDANGPTFTALLSEDANAVAFESPATNLVPGDTNDASDVFVRDRAAGRTVRASVSSRGAQANGESVNASLSADGNTVVFQSLASNLVPGVSGPQVYARMLDASMTKLVSAGAHNRPGNGASMIPVVSGNGRFVAFVSYATNLVPGDTNAAADVFVRDMVEGTTKRIVTAAGPNEPGDGAFPEIAISADGRFVAVSTSDALVATDGNGTRDVYVIEHATGAIELVSGGLAGAGADGPSNAPMLSRDGSVVVFGSGASNLVDDDTNAFHDVFLRNRSVDATVRVSVTRGNEQLDADSYPSSVSADGRRVAFAGSATNIVEGDDNGVDVFVRDVADRTTRRAALSVAGTPGNLPSRGGSLNADGSVVAFLSDASNLVPGDGNGWPDAFVRELGPAVVPTLESLTPRTLRTGEPVELTLKLSLPSGVGLAGRTVRIWNRETPASTTKGLVGYFPTDEAGMVRVPYGGATVPRDYYFEAYFLGDDTAVGAETTFTLTILKKGSSIEIVQPSPGVYDYYGGIGVRLLDDEGAPIGNAEVVIELETPDGRIPLPSSSTDHRGLAGATWLITQSPGTYPVHAAFPGDAYHTGSATSGTFTVIKRSMTVSYSGPASMPWGRTWAFGAQVRDVISRQTLAGRTVRLGLVNPIGEGTVWSGTGVTDGDGFAWFQVELDVPPGEYRLDMDVDGDDTYLPASSSVSFGVTRHHTVVDYLGYDYPTADRRVVDFRGKLIDGSGAPIPAATVTFSVFDGNTLLQTTSGVTDANGLAKGHMELTPPRGNYTVVTSFDGNAGYLPSSHSFPLYIPGRTLSIRYTGPQRVTADDDVAFSARLVDAATNEPVAGKTIRFDAEFHGTEYGSATGVSDANGHVTATIRVTGPSRPNENHVVWMSFERDDVYETTDAIGGYWVDPRPTTLTLENVSGWQSRGDVLHLRATLADDARSSGVAGRPITFVLKEHGTWNEVWRATVETDASGVAAIDKRVVEPNGQYYLGVDFERDDTYDDAHAQTFFSVRWKYELYGLYCDCRISINPAMKEFRFDADGDEIPDTIDENMTITILPDGSQLIEIDYAGPAGSVRGTFYPALNVVKAEVTTPKRSYTMVNY